MVDRGSFANASMANNMLPHVDERVKGYVPLDNMTPLSKEYQPTSWDVLCGRGNYDHCKFLSLAFLPLSLLQCFAWFWF